jgi:peptide deformylase
VNVGYLRAPSLGAGRENEKNPLSTSDTMAILEILHFPDPRLRSKAAPVDEVDARIKQTVADMFETMYASSGIGLAATQVNIHQRIIVIDLSEDHSQPVCLINPQLLASEGQEKMDEGCLSVPGIFEPVRRAGKITVQFLDQQGQTCRLTTDGLLAVCIQHEMDHLEGKLFVDYLSSLKRERIRAKLVRQRRQTL